MKQSSMKELKKEFEENFSIEPVQPNLDYLHYYGKLGIWDWITTNFIPREEVDSGSKPLDEVKKEFDKKFNNSEGYLVMKYMSNYGEVSCPEDVWTFFLPYLSEGGHNGKR
jgi:hypothetical protein